MSEGEPIARLRVKPMLTAYSQRIRLMEEMHDRPEKFRVRSLRRRLTKLDRALTDEEAYALDRAHNAWLSLHGKSKSVDFSAPGGGSSSGDSSPLDCRELDEAKHYAQMRTAIGAGWRMHMDCLFYEWAPWTEGKPVYELAMIIDIARKIKKAYERKENLQS